MKYPGKLGKSRSNSIPPGLLATVAQQEEWISEQVRISTENMRALFDFYGFKYGDWMHLAWALVEDNVPAFGERHATLGRPEKWDEIRRARLCIETEQIIENAKPRKMSLTSALATLAKNPHWKDVLGNATKPADALRKQYEKANRAWVTIVRKADAYDLLPEFERANGGPLSLGDMLKLGN